MIQQYRKVRSGFLLDTNIISHLINNKKPHIGVVDFFEQVEEDELFLSVITLGEIQKGLMLLFQKRQEHVSLNSLLMQRLNATIERFSGRIIPIDEKIARAWGDLQAYSQGVGMQSAVTDGLIAASAHVHDLVVVSGDADFKIFKGQLIVYNPFAT